MVVNVSSLSVNEPEGAMDKDGEASVFLWVWGYSVSLLPPCQIGEYSVLVEPKSAAGSAVLVYFWDLCSAGVEPRAFPC